jgi:hypothetical protein
VRRFSLQYNDITYENEVNFKEFELYIYQLWFLPLYRSSFFYWLPIYHALSISSIKCCP